MTEIHYRCNDLMLFFREDICGVFSLHSSDFPLPQHFVNMIAKCNFFCAVDFLLSRTSLPAWYLHNANRPSRVMIKGLVHFIRTWNRSVICRCCLNSVKGLCATVNTMLISLSIVETERAEVTGCPTQGFNPEWSQTA